MALVCGTTLLPGGGEGLAGAGAGPHGPVVGPPGEPESEGPAADPGEEVALRVAGEIVRPHVADVPLVHVSGANMSGCHQPPQPLGRERIVLVVVGAGIHDRLALRPE